MCYKGVATTRHTFLFLLVAYYLISAINVSKESKMHQFSSKQKLQYSNDIVGCLGASGWKVEFLIKIRIFDNCRNKRKFAIGF
jgi:hypothetical protein